MDSKLQGIDAAVFLQAGTPFLASKRKAQKHVPFDLTDFSPENLRN